MVQNSFEKIWYKYTKFISFLNPIFNKFNHLEVSLNEICLPEIIKYNDFLSKPQSDFLGKIVKINDSKDFVQILDSDLSPKFSIIDLANNYASMINDHKLLIVFGKEDDEALEYFFIRPGNPSEQVILPIHLKYTKDMPEYENKKVLKRKFNYLLDMYSAKYDKIIFIGKQDQKEKYFDYENVTHIHKETIKHLFEITEPLIEHNEKIKIILKQILISIIVPTFLVFSIVNFVSSTILSSYSNSLSELKMNNEVLIKEKNSKKELLDKTKKDVVVKEVFQ